ncbi:hypothetical protein DICPUDRAFT_42283 [Dictyostelium purpureum]|uniref:Uncharacterized protein n=1 Tax=Dictyostelium purpureum TaxID=5786 RepID=F1A1S1_DICPU|nr:uncharacterized protein DICPUDRAFT_42283 [Dictyostelium purpureum]EGC29858.1 hypothetical protein DICPUDRAFT_42283 [Dictyostelium purpureum]|eukprot:XP_003293613.1 hypothetical protein DICPUDRAFT_42283 [Dictyostelium purpureum]
MKVGSIIKLLSNLRIQIVLLALAGWALALSIDRTYVEDFRDKSDAFFKDTVPVMVRTKNQNAALIILSIFETLLFGLGVGFFVAVGFRVFKIKNSMLRKRMIWCWATISFFMIEWWPHSTSHFLINQNFDPQTKIKNYIVMETTFHWTITFCSATLGYFQYDLIKLMYEVAMMRLKMKEGREVDPLKQEWWKNYYYHAAIIACIFFAPAMVVCFHYEPVTIYQGIDLLAWQKFFFVTFHIVNSAVLSVGVGFAYVAIRTIRLLPPSPGKRVSVISSIAITFLFIIQYPHPFVHNHTQLNMYNVIAVDFGVHIPIVIATGVLAFYQFRMLELATDEKSSLSVAAQMRRKSGSSQHSGNNSMKSIDGGHGTTGSFATSSIEESLSKNSSQEVAQQREQVIEIKKDAENNVEIELEDIQK